MTEYRDPRLDHRSDHLAHDCPVQTAARVVSLALLVLGSLGFVPGVTTDYGEMGFAGYLSRAKLFGLFQVSVLHNVVHLLFGLCGLAAGRTAVASRSFLLGGGGVFVLLFLFGLEVGDLDDTNVVPLNGHDDWLHLLVGVTMAVLGVALWHHREVGRTVHVEPDRDRGFA